MSSARTEEIFEELKKFLNPGIIWQKVLLPHYDLLKSFFSPTTELKVVLKVFIPFYNFTIVFVAFVPKKISKSLKVF